MITIGQFKAVVTQARIQEFDNKDKTKHFQVLEVSFFSDELRISGILKDWSKRIPEEFLPYGTEIIVRYDACSPMKGTVGFYEFRGECDLIHTKK